MGLSNSAGECVLDPPALVKGRSSMTSKDRETLLRTNTQQAITKLAEPIKVTWQDLNYTVQIPDPDNKKQTRPLQVLKDCSGVANPGQTLYIMGASGAGKTSLMNVLSDRISLANGAKLTGQVRLNDTTPLA